MIISTRNLLTKSNLFSLITSYQIFNTYCKNFEYTGKAFKSEFRDEKSPSCVIEYMGGDLLYTDFGEGSYRAIEFVMRKYNLTFKDALRKINLDFGLGLIDNSTIEFQYVKTDVKRIDKIIDFKEKSKTIIDVHYSEWSGKDLDYWNKYGWTLEMLKKASIRPIDNFWLTIPHKNMDRTPFCVNNELVFTYDYYRHNDIYMRKLYFPERTGKRKWISNVDNTVIQNWDLLPKEGGDLLFIVSSKKDSGPHWRLNPYKYCNAISPNSEGSFLPEDIFFRKIKPRWKRIIAWLDNDATGITNALKWSKKYQIEAAWNPLRCPHKDQSDMVLHDGLREFNYQSQKLIL